MQDLAINFVQEIVIAASDAQVRRQHFSNIVRESRNALRVRRHQRHGVQCLRGRRRRSTRNVVLYSLGNGCVLQCFVRDAQILVRQKLQNAQGKPIVAVFARKIKPFVNKRETVEFDKARNRIAIVLDQIIQRIQVLLTLTLLSENFQEIFHVDAWPIIELRHRFQHRSIDMLSRARQSINHVANCVMMRGFAAHVCCVSVDG
mmetsp:Transcript_25384/g.41368  ORF Transcript_25384/g.41368 Transcript_25384/m.41368 type:complete len:203 (+) Transcript_25384:1438-2046(+)